MKILNNRKCIATGKVQPKENLLRIVKLKDGRILVDSDQKGRGAYITRDISLFDKVSRQKLLNRTFRTEIDKSVYEELKIKLEEA